MPAEPVSNFRHRDLLPVNRFYTGKAKPDTTQLYREFDNGWASSLGRVPTLAIYSLAALAACDLSNQAIATQPSSPAYFESGNFVVPNAEEPATKEVMQGSAPSAIASPESLTVQEFTPETSRASESPSKGEVTPLQQPDTKLRLIVVHGEGREGGEDGEVNSPLSPSSPQRVGLLSLNATSYEQGTQNVTVQTLESPSPQAISRSIAPPETEVTVAQMSTQTADAIPVMQSAAPQVASSQVAIKNITPLASSASSASPAASASCATPAPQETVSPQQNPIVVAQGKPTATKPCLEVEGLQSQLRAVQDIKDVGEFQASPALSIVIPTGFGADNNTGFISATYQNRTRYTDVSDGSLGVGVGLGDARKSVGVELSYAIASFGGSRDFGSGGFNVKLHRQLPNDFAVAAGWNGFLNLGGRNDFEQSLYGAVTKVFRARDDINLPFSRVAVTAGIGNGQFRSEDAVAKGENNINVFGNVAVRVAEPVSLIAEWSGQDLGVGLSVAPFKNIPLVITPAVRDIIGAGNGPRFVLGSGFAFKF